MKKQSQKQLFEEIKKNKKQKQQQTSNNNAATTSFENNAENTTTLQKINYTKQLFGNETLLLQGIFSYLDLSDLFESCLVVSKNFYKNIFCKDFWKNYCIELPLKGTNNFFNGLMSRCFVNEWNVVTVSDVTILQFLTVYKNNLQNIPFKNLKKIKIEILENLNIFNFVNYLKNLTNLEIIIHLDSLQNFKIVKEKLELPNLENLQISVISEEAEEQPDDSEDEMDDSEEKVKKVPEEEIVNDEELESLQEITNMLMSSSEKLTTFSVSGNSPILEEIHFPTESLQNLLNLEIYFENIKNFTFIENNLLNILQKNKNLQKIEINLNKENFKNEKYFGINGNLLFLEILKNCNKILELSISGMNHSTNMEIEENLNFENFKNLEKFEFKNSFEENIPIWLNLFLEKIFFYKKLKILKIKNIILKNNLNFNPDKKNSKFLFLDELFLNLENLNSLQEINFKNIPITKNTLQNFFKKNIYKNLFKLSFGLNFNFNYYIENNLINFEILENILQKFPNLESLWISDCKINSIFNLISKFNKKLLKLNLQAPEMRGRDILNLENLKNNSLQNTLQNLLNLKIYLQTSNEELLQILNNCPNLFNLTVYSSNLTNMVMECISESKCSNKLMNIKLIDMVSSIKVICSEEEKEIKKITNYKMNTIFRNLRSLDVSIAPSFLSLYFLITLVCNAPNLEELLLNGNDLLEGIAREHLCIREIEEELETLKRKKNTKKNTKMNKKGKSEEEEEGKRMKWNLLWKLQFLKL
ncbi:hypothetical protein ABK040_015872 [Willaertia magna]